MTKNNKFDQDFDFEKEYGFDPNTILDPEFENDEQMQTSFDASFDDTLIKEFDAKFDEEFDARFTAAFGEEFSEALSQETVVVPENKPKTRMKGFGGALASTIICNVGVFFVGISYGLLLIDLKMIGLIVAAIAFAVMLVSLILGIKSVLTFKRVVRAKNPAPIATLILGLYGLVMSAEGFIMGITYVAEGLDILNYFHFT